MNEGTFHSISDFLKQSQFEIIPTDSDKVKMYATFHNSSLYLINSICLSDSYTFSKEKFIKYKKITEQQFSNVNASKIILLNLIITEYAKDIYDDINYTPDMEAHLIDINWIIDVENNELMIPSKQIKHVIGLEKDIQRLLRTDGIVRDNKIIEHNKTPILSYGLIALNIMIWFYMELAGGTTNNNILIKFGAIHSINVLQYGEYWRIFTSMFIHIGATHLFYNCFSLYIFGTRIEKFMKRWQFIFLYIFSGLTGGIFSLAGAYYTQGLKIAAGASGAIYGLIGGLLAYTIKTRKQVGGLSSYTLLLMFIVGIIYGFVSRGVDNLAHIGGFIGGFLISLIMIKLQRNE